MAGHHRVDRDCGDVVSAPCPYCGPGYRTGDEGCRHLPARWVHLAADALPRGTSYWPNLALNEITALMVLDPVLADITAQVQALRDQHGPGRAMAHGVPYFCGQCDALDAVLAILRTGGEQ